MILIHMRFACAFTKLLGLSVFTQWFDSSVYSHSHFGVTERATDYFSQPRCHDVLVYVCFSALLFVQSS